MTEKELEKEMNYYELLGISEDASSEEIKQAYRSNIKEWHPDLHPDKPDAAAKTQEINEAYDILSDPNKKAKYDEYLGFSRACKVTPIRNQDDTVTEQAPVKDDTGVDYSNMSFEDYVENVANESYSTYKYASNKEKHKFDEQGYREYSKNKVWDKEVNVSLPILIFIGFVCCLSSVTFSIPGADKYLGQIVPIVLLVFGAAGTIIIIRQRSQAAKKERETQMGGNDSMFEADKWFEVWLYPEMPLSECRKVFFDFSVAADKHLLKRFNMLSDEEKKQYSDIIELLEECIRFRERKK